MLNLHLYFLERRNTLEKYSRDEIYPLKHVGHTRMWSSYCIGIIAIYSLFDIDIYDY